MIFLPPLEKEVVVSEKSEKPGKSQRIPSSRSSDHRYLPRWQVNNRIFYRLEKHTKAHECQSKDLSCMGACLATKESLDPNQKVQLTIYLTEDQPIEVNGHIVWNAKTSGENLAGVIFDNLSLKSQDMILKYAFEIKKEDLINHWFKGWEKS